MKRAYIFGAGEYDGPPPAVQRDDLLLAADGGYDYLSRNGMTPQLLLGDLDSLKTPPAGLETRVFPTEKNETDMELAVQEALSRGAEELYLYGALGGRLDHTLANIQLVAGLARKGFRAYLVSEKTTVTALHDGALRFSEAFTGTLSVFAYGGEARGVTLVGLRYPLTDYVLPDDVSLGVSNEFTGREARVSVADGTLLLLWSGNRGVYPSEDGGKL